MRDLAHRFFICLLACSTTHALLGQSNPQAPGEVSSSSAVDSSQTQLEQKLGTIALALATTRQQLEQSQRQIQQLQEELTQVAGRNSELLHPFPKKLLLHRNHKWREAAIYKSALRHLRRR